MWIGFCIATFVFYLLMGLRLSSLEEKSKLLSIGKTCTSFCI